MLTTHENGVFTSDTLKIKAELKSIDRKTQNRFFGSKNRIS
jgi:hypothetical protein